MDSSSCHFAPVFPNRAELKNKRPQYPLPPEGFPTRSDWVVEFENFEAVDKKNHVFAHLFRPEKPTRGLEHKALIVSHGQGEQSGRYLHWPHFLHDTVGSIYAIDHLGHGQSTGMRGSIVHFDDYAHNLARGIERYSNYLKGKYGKAEIHLAGHSMGGLIVLRTLLLHPKLELASVTLSAPMLELAVKVPWVKAIAAKALLRVAPLVPIPTTPLADLVSRDPAVVKHYAGDPLNHGKASASFFFSFLEVSADTFAQAENFHHPMLFILPMGDRIIDPKATEKFYGKLKAPEKKLLRFPGLYHESFNEPEKAEVFAALREWIAAHSR